MIGNWDCWIFKFSKLNNRAKPKPLAHHRAQTGAHGVKMSDDIKISINI